MSDAGMLLSASFFDKHRTTFARDYGDISDPRVSIPGARGSQVDYVLDYTYKGTGKFRLFWERTGSWKFSHGTAGWLMDEDAWKSIHIVAVTSRDGTHYDVQDKVFSDGHHTYNTPDGFTVAFTATPAGGWKTDVVSTPQTTVANAPTTVPAYQPQAYVPRTGAVPVGGTYGAPSGCEQVTVEDVFHDGEVLHTLDDRYVRVADADTVTASVWVAPFEGYLCSDHFVNTDDNESVEIVP